MKTKSRITGEIYESDEMVYIVNTLQAGKYIKHDAMLHDCFWSRDSLVFVFSRSETKTLYDLWCKRELD